MFKKTAHIFIMTLLMLGGCFCLALNANALPADSTNNSLSASSLLETKQNQLDQIKVEILQYTKGINLKEEEINELGEAIGGIEEEIVKIGDLIRETNLKIEEIDSNIDKYKDLILQEEAAIKHQKILIAGYLQEIYETSDLTTLQTVLGKKKISEFLNNEESLTQAQKSIYEAIQEVKQRKLNLEKAKYELEIEKQEQRDLRSLQEVQKISLEEKNEEKISLLEKAKSNKFNLEKLLLQARSKFDSVRSEIRLIGDSEVLGFEDALEYANFVEEKIGVRSALVLAILKQESNWGKNTGTSIYLDALSGCVNSKKGEYGGDYDSALAVAQRREKDFLKITEELGIPETTLVSACPRNYLGTGGAMGPAQFMPDTWLGYKEELTALKGELASPFDVRDAMLAMGTKLSRAGASSQIREIEWKSAMIYFAGGNWDNPNYSFYGDSVMSLANAYQNEIDKQD